MNFGNGTKFIAIRRNKVATVRSVHIKESKYSGTDEIHMDLYSHANTCVLKKECLKVYDWNRSINVYGWNPKDRKWICQTISGAVAYDHP